MSYSPNPLRHNPDPSTGLYCMDCLSNCTEAKPCACDAPYRTTAGPEATAPVPDKTTAGPEAAAPKTTAGPEATAPRLVSDSDKGVSGEAAG